jgi:hypothetical protein
MSRDALRQHVKRRRQFLLEYMTGKCVNLVDVFQPAVADALDGSTMTAPHTHYDYDTSGNESDQIGAIGEATTATGNTMTWT